MGRAVTQVDFYMVHGGARDLFVCRLVEKAFALRNDVFIHTASEQAARAIDDLLWTFRPGSFVPHEIITEAQAHEACPVCLGFGLEPQGRCGVLVNLDDDVPVFFSRFERVLEVMSDEEHDRVRGRDHYAFYRDRGYALAYHEINR